MNYDRTIKELNAWQMDECLFRDYFPAKKGKLSFDDFYEKYELCPAPGNLYPRI